MSTSVRRVVPVALFALFTGLASGCTPPVEPRAGGNASRCTVEASTVDEAHAALDGAQPGTVVCLRGSGLADGELVLGRSGSPTAPIVVVSDGVPVRSVEVRADHVVVEGVTTAAGGSGITLSGTSVVARRNDVRSAVDDGIRCERCADAVIEDNVVTGADGSGILVEGEDLTVRGNRVTGSVRRTASDADGIRFFGSRITLSGNEIADITRAGYASDPPHTDCFQTFDNSGLPAVDVLIEDNICRNVDDQCLIATAEAAGREGVIGRSRGIRFVGNRCDVGASQAVLVQWVPGVEVRNNRLWGPELDRGAYFGDGATGGRFFANDVPPGVAPYQVDETSRAGFATDRPT